MSKTEYTRKLELALWELIRRWPDERGYAVAIGHACQLLLEAPGAGSDDHAGSVGEQAPV